jgi:hypothetical protein
MPQGGSAMTTRLITLVFVFALMILTASTVSAASLAYTLNLAGSSDGFFVVDPSLAALLGPSGVALNDFKLNLNTSAGLLTFGPADLTGGFIEARFLDGQLAGLRSVTGTTAEVLVPGHYGIAIFFKIAAGTAADINPNLAGEGNFTIVSLPSLTPVDDVCCSYGFAPASVPETSSAFLLTLALVVVVAASRYLPTQVADPS